MALRNYTKRLFAEALTDMMRMIPLEKTRVKDLCDRCGAQRQSFYYHFRDKYDLVAYIYSMYSMDYTAALESTGGTYGIEYAIEFLHRLKEKQSFYKKAYSDKSQNAISQYIFDFHVQLGTDAVKRYLAADTLDTATVYAIKSYAFACVGHTVEWFQGQTDYSPEEFARLQYQFMPPVLKQAYGIV